MKIEVHSMGKGRCALTQKETEGLTVAFDSEAPCFLGKKGFWQILSMRAVQARPETKPQANGAAVAATK